MKTANLVNNLHPELDACYIEQWLEPAETEIYFQKLITLPFADEFLTMFGKSVRMPRKVLWVADTGVEYTYSGQPHTPAAWTDELNYLREKLAMYASFNSVLANYYNDGNDYMGWHSDDEASLGVAPVIASLSFGASRAFKFRHKQDKHVVTLELAAGSLLLMHGNSQTEWQHMLPKRLKISEPRLNLTFRNVHT